MKLATHREIQRLRTFGVHRLALSSLLAAIGAACIVSPVPQPPNIEAPTMEIGDVTFDPCLTCDTDSVALTAPPGTVTHPELQDEVELWIANLDLQRVPQRVPVEADGSFEAQIVGMGLDVFRVQARVRDARSAPWDVTAGDEGEPVELITHPLQGCLSLEPASEIDFFELERGRVLSLTLTASEDCADDVVLSSVELRMSSTAFELHEVPTRIAPGDQRTMYVELVALEPGDYEEILLIEVSDPESDRFAVTLIGRVPES